MAALLVESAVASDSTGSAAIGKENRRIRTDGSESEAVCSPGVYPTCEDVRCVMTKAAPLRESGVLFLFLS